MASASVVLAVVIAAAPAPAAVQAATASPVPVRTMQVTAAQLFHLADIALAEGDQTTALRAYNALMSDPSADIQLEARFRLAMLESKKGNLTRAALLLRQVVDRRPSATRARLELAGLLDRMGDKDGAWRQVRAIHAGGLPPNVARLIDRGSTAGAAAVRRQLRDRVGAGQQHQSRDALRHARHSAWRLPDR
jgi:hypothetical protein